MDEKQTQYYETIFKNQRISGVQVKNCHGKGKGLFATQKFETGELVFTESKLVGMQHYHNKLELLEKNTQCCDHCMRFIGPFTAFLDWDGPAMPFLACERDNDQKSADIPVLDVNKQIHTQHETANKVHGDTIKRQSNKYVYSSNIFPCKSELGSCEVQYCSIRCRDQAWDNYHQLLCFGFSQPASDIKSDHASNMDDDDSPSSGDFLKLFVQHALDTNEIFLLAAKAYANTILIALRKTALVDCEESTVEDAYHRYRLFTQEPWWDIIARASPGADGEYDQEELGTDANSLVSTDEMCDKYDNDENSDKKNDQKNDGKSDEQSDEKQHDEDGHHDVKFALQQLLSDSFELLSAALIPYSQHSAFQKLFSLDRYACLIGAFEQNNIGLCAVSPLHRYLSFVETELEQPETDKLKDFLNARAFSRDDVDSSLVAVEATDKSGTEHNTGDQIQNKDGNKDKEDEVEDEDEDEVEDEDEDEVEDGTYWTHMKHRAKLIAEGTALFAIGCCMNHSCSPNIAVLKTDQDNDDTAAMYALTDIEPGDELCISYIDEEMPMDDRRAALMDYSFVCRCVKCLKEDTK